VCDLIHALITTFFNTGLFEHEYPLQKPSVTVVVAPQKDLKVAERRLSRKRKRAE
jgi:hypothetical protein